VGLGQKPNPVYLKPGDVVELGIEGLGTQKQMVEGWESERYKV
jgi:2-keto-4-pentenoate hydratase/2-oxohepta-3-ene-1,7-dioic acid hydratase in catechol pathway